MATRMTKELRAFLQDLAFKKVLPDPASEKEFQAAKKAANAAVWKGIAKTFPAKDMKVLLKYQCATRQRSASIPLGYTFGDKGLSFEHHTLCSLKTGKEFAMYEASPEVPLLPATGSNRVQLDEEASKVYTAFITLRAERERKRKDTLTAVQFLVNNARTLEQIEEAWPAAKDARQLVRSVPAVILGPIIDKIKEAVAEKRA